MTPPCPCLSYPYWYALCAVVAAAFAAPVSTCCDMPGQTLSSDGFGACAIAGTRFTVVSNASVAPASNRVSFQYSVMIQQTAALPLDRRWQIDRRHASRKFRNAILDSQT